MKIGVVGGTGFLGNYVLKELRRNNHEYIVLSRKVVNHGHNKDNIVSTNYSKEDLIKKLNGLDAVIYLAAKRSPTNYIRDFHDNEILTQNLYQSCLELNIKNIVYASTISVYSNEKELPWKESSSIEPKLMYGVSKFSCELIGNIYNKKYNMNIKNLRLAHLYGFNEKNNYMINKFMRQAFNKQPLKLNSLGVKREFLYAKDAASAIVMAISKSDIFGTYNVGSEESLNNYEVANSINNIFENYNKIDFEYNQEISKETASYMKSDLFRKTFNFSCSYTFESALSEIFEQMKGLENVPIIY